LIATKINLEESTFPKAGRSPVSYWMQHNCEEIAVVLRRQFTGGTAMTDNTELQRLTRLRRLARQIAASLQTDVDREQAFQVHGYVRELLESQPLSRGT
jgi:hypothetical protein